MKQNTFKALLLIVIAGTVVIFSSFKLNPKPWVVPEKFMKMPNPVKADAAVLKEAKALWSKHCQSCHGKSGLGDGSKAAQLKTDPGDLSSAEFHKQTDGSMYYKVAEGRDDMPSFKKKVDEEEMWQLVVYMRTFKK